MSTDHRTRTGVVGNRIRTGAVAALPVGRRRGAVLAAALVVILALFAAFATRHEAYGAEAAPTSDALVGRTFEAVEARGADLPTASAVTVTFDDGHVAASAGCNTLFGGAAWDGGRLVLEGELASTMMACPHDVELFEAWLAGLLASDPAVELDGTTLILGDQTTGLVLEEQVAATA
jgi:heat shock protein HslJ